MELNFDDAVELKTAEEHQRDAEEEQRAAEVQQGELDDAFETLYEIAYRQPDSTLCYLLDGVKELLEKRGEYVDPDYRPGEAV